MECQQDCSFLIYVFNSMAIISKPKPDSTKPPKPLSLSFSNVRGLRSKFDQVESFLSDSSPDIFALCESNLNPSIDSSDFLAHGYLPINRKDSPNHMHGLGVYVRESLPVSRDFNFEISDQPFMCFRVSLLNSISYLFFLYRSPSSQSCSVINAVSDCIDRALISQPSANIFVFGDFNVHHSDWLSFSGPTRPAGVEAYNFSISQSLTQMVDFATRFPDRDDQRPSTLDLFLSSNPDICSVSGSSPLGSSDHLVVNVSIDLNTISANDSPYHRTLYSYNQGDWDSFRDLVRDLPLDDIFALNVNECAREVASWLQAGINAFVPHRTYQVKPHSNPWFSPACAAAIAHRNHFFHQYHRSGTMGDKQLFNNARNRCKRVIEEAKQNYLNQVHDRIVGQSVGSRDFWRIYKSISNKGKSSVPPLFNGPEVLTSTSDKAELLARFFSSNSSLDDSGHQLPEFPSRTGEEFCTVDITTVKIANIIKSLDPSKATGPDGIPVIVLQKCSPELSPILSKLFRKCVAESCFPSSWKVASVVPVFKNSGERSDPKNYRPISLLSVISKIFESLINSSLTQHLDSNKLLSDHQYGFRAGRSTADALTVISERILQSLDVCGETRAIALDISKAFDKVWHAGLIHKLMSYGVSGHALNIIKSFLSDRKIKVVLDGRSSSCYFINAGVPQGSILGPTLFLIFINDLPDNILSKLAIYADDTTLFSSLGRTKSVFDHIEMAGELEYDLRTVKEWGDEWLVSFNASKTKLLSINKFRDPFLPTISMNGVEISESSHFKLLGLTFSNNFSWNEYISSVAKSAVKKIGSLFRVRNCLSPKTILYLYKSSIRPCMEYCCHLWAGAPANCLNLLNRLQKRISNIVGPELASGLHSLAHRRDVASLSLFYRYINGRCSDELYQLAPPLKQFARVTRQACKAHILTVKVPACNKNFYSSSFFPRTAKLWNSLPNTCFPTQYDLQSFKSNVNRFLLLSV